MARQARQYAQSGLFHIHQRSGSPRKLFENDQDRQAFLAILGNAKARFGFQLYSFCLLSDTDYHLVIDVSGNDLSKIMKSINIAYAMYAKAPGPLFKDRYQSTALETPSEVRAHIDTLHEKAKNYTEATSHGFTSFCTYNPHAPLRLDLITLLSPDLHELVLKPCDTCIKTYPEAEA